MLERFGKTVDMRNINRSVGAIHGIVRDARGVMEKFYRESGG